MTGVVAKTEFRNFNLGKGQPQPQPEPEARSQCVSICKNFKFFHAPDLFVIFILLLTCSTDFNLPRPDYFKVSHSLINS